jgi:hypothetical protein
VLRIEHESFAKKRSRATVPAVYENTEFLDLDPRRRGDGHAGRVRDEAATAAAKTGSGKACAALHLE